VEDPTRVFRAIRFEQRFKFRVSKLTANLIANAVKNNFFDRLSGARLFGELRLILQETNHLPAIARLAEFNLLAPIHPRLRYDEGTKGMLERVQAVLSWFDLLYLEEKFDRWLVYFLGLVEPLAPEELEEMVQRFKISPKKALAITRGKETADQTLMRLYHLGEEPGRVEIYRLLSPLGTEFLLYMMAKTKQEASKKAISLYFTHLKHLKPELRGRDLLALGFTPGPLIKEMLDRLHEARLTEEVKTRKEELDLIRRSFGP
jgi:tRNA nucleotidyltransferase (CCA-adding enzyme)